LRPPDETIKGPVAVGTDAGFVLGFVFEFDDTLGAGQSVGDCIEGRPGKNIAAGNIEIACDGPKRGDGMA